MSYKFEQHLDEESLENYAFGRLEDDRAETLEEHLLICDECRAKLDATDQYIKAMARGSRVLQEQSGQHDLGKTAAWFVPAWFAPGFNLGSFRVPAMAWALAAIALCAVLFVSTKSFRRGESVLAPIAVSLTSERGAAQTVPARHPLLLHLDARGLEPRFTHVTLVDASGAKLEEMTAPTSESVDIKVSKPLQPGTYYLRILKPGSSESAREFVLDVH